MVSFKRSLIVLTMLPLVGCTHTVQLGVQNTLPVNATSPSLEVTAVSKDKNGMEGTTTKLGSAAPSKSVSGSFKVADKGSYVVKAYLDQGGASGALVYTGGEKTIVSDSTDSLTISKLSAPTLDVTDTSTIQQAFGTLGPQIGFNPVTLRSALTSLYGGLVVYAQPSGDGVPASQPVVVVDAAAFTGAIPYADFSYPTTSSTKTISISTDASAKAAASVPLWGSLTANFSANSVYQLNWDLEGYGNVLKADAAGSTFQDKLASLSQPIKDDICQRLSVPSTEMVYVNQIYVVRSAILSYKKGDSVSAGVAANGGSIITGSAAYDFSTAQTQSSRADEQVVNIGGPTWTKSTLSFCSAGGVVGAPPKSTIPIKPLPGTQILLKGTEPAKVNFK